MRTSCSTPIARRSTSCCNAKRRTDGDTPTIVSVTTGRHRAAGAATHVAARRVAAAGDGRHELRRVGERLVAVGEESRQHEAARRDRGRGDGRVRSRSSTSAQPVDSVAKLLSKSNPAVLVRSNGTVQGIVTRSDMLNYLMAR